MPWFGRKVYDRTRLLDQAMQATRRRRRKRAIGYYREILAVDPNDAHVHRKVAPLFGHTKQLDDAWQSYRLAASQLTRQGFVDQAIGVYREASAFLTKDHRLWLALGELELERKRPVDAVNVLVEGARHLRSRRTQQEALTLLQRARKIQPHAFDPTYELANLLVRAGARDRARKLLQALAPRVKGRQLRRLRRRLFVLSPSPANAWRWVASWFSR